MADASASVSASAISSSGGGSAWSALKDNLLFVGIVVALVGLVALLSYLGSKPRFSTTFQDKVRELVRESTRWSATAEQDNNAALALSHATYGAAYLKVARSLASDRDLENVTRVNVTELSDIVNNREQRALGEVMASCGATGHAAVYTGYL